MSSGGASRHSFFAAARRRFFSDAQGWFGVIGILLLLIPAIAAPLLANGRPLVVWGGEKGVYFPFAAFLFAPDSTEFLIEQFFNFTLLFLPVVFVIVFLVRRKLLRWIFCGVAALLLIVPFFYKLLLQMKRNI